MRLKVSKKAHQGVTGGEVDKAFNKLKTRNKSWTQSGGCEVLEVGRMCVWSNG